jgi:hypothetical protein
MIPSITVELGLRFYSGWTNFVATYLVPPRDIAKIMLDKKYVNSSDFGSSMERFLMKNSIGPNK